MDEYILMFEDNRELYYDVLIKVISIEGKTYDEIYEYYHKNANDVIVNSFGFEDDGCWKLRKMIKLDEMNKLYI